MSDVILYSRPGCGACIGAAAHLRRRGVVFETRNFDDLDPLEGYAVRLMGTTLPILVVDHGNSPDDLDVVVGFDPAYFDRATSAGWFTPRPARSVAM